MRLHIARTIRKAVAGSPYERLTEDSQRSKGSLLSRYSWLGVPLAIWLCLFVFFQKYQPWAEAGKCSFAPPHEDGVQAYKVLLVADPQLIDNHTYPDYNPATLWVSKFTVDNYIYKNYWALVKQLEPDSIVFLGDLLDNGRSSSDEYYLHELQRFYRIFRPGELREKGVEVVMNVPGNHDIGFGNDVKKHALDRFKDAFDEPNQILEHANHELISLDSISLSDTKYEDIALESKTFLRQIKDRKLEKPRVLFGHVPLFRDPEKEVCGPRRESARPIPAVAGHQYQTLIDPAISDVILRYTKPSLVFSGDDHDYCEVVHEYDVNGVRHHAIEVTVKSISMAMGIAKPAVELLTLYSKPVEDFTISVHGQELPDIEASFAYNMCYLPPPYEDILFYAVFAVFNFLYLLYQVFSQTRPAHTSLAIDEVYEEPKFLQRLKSLSVKYLLELCLVEAVIVWFTYYALFTVHYY